MFVPSKLIPNNQSSAILNSNGCLQFLGMFIFKANLRGIISVKPHRKTKRQKEQIFLCTALGGAQVPNVLQLWGWAGKLFPPWSGTNCMSSCVVLQYKSTQRPIFLVPSIGLNKYLFNQYCMINSDQQKFYPNWLTTLQLVAYGKGHIMHRPLQEVRGNWLYVLQKVI